MKIVSQYAKIEDALRHLVDKSITHVIDKKHSGKGIVNEVRFYFKIF